MIVDAYYSVQNRDAEHLKYIEKFDPMAELCSQLKFIFNIKSKS